jgi:hypothetical protein
MLCFFQENPKKSASQEVYGSFDFNKTPLVPLETKALLYNDPGSQTSLAPHATDGFYVGTASDHYRCLQFYIPAMCRFRFSNTWCLYPAHCQVPVTLQHDLSIAAAADLLKVFGGTVPKSTTEKMKHIRAIQELTAIIAGQRTTPPTVEDASSPRVVAPCLRVATTPPPRVATTSNNIMTFDAIRQMQLVHQHHTCNKKPFHILSDDDDDDDTILASNCSPSAHPTIMPASIPPVNPPMRQSLHQLTMPTPIPPPTVPPRHLPTTPPLRVQTTQTANPTLHPLHHTKPSTTNAQSHHKNYSSHCLTPSSKPTPFLLWNRIKSGIVRQPQDHPACPNAPPDSSAIEHPAISHARHYVTLLTWDLLMPLPSLPLENLPMINTQVLLLKLKNIAMVYYTLSPKKPSPITGS